MLAPPSNGISNSSKIRQKLLGNCAKIGEKTDVIKKLNM